MIIDALFYPSSVYRQGMIPFIIGQESTQIPPLLRRPLPRFLIIPRYPKNKPLGVLEHEKIKRITALTMLLLDPLQPVKWSERKALPFSQIQPPCLLANLLQA
jgi:hypothetical protein